MYICDYEFLLTSVEFLNGGTVFTSKACKAKAFEVLSPGVFCMYSDVFCMYSCMC